MGIVQDLKNAGARPLPQQALPILHTVYLYAFLMLVVPVALLGLLFVGQRWEDLYFWVWLVLCGVLSGTVLGLAGRAYKEGASFKNALAVAIRLGSAPAVPALFAALHYSDVGHLLAFLGLSLLFYGAGWWMLRQYAGPYQA